MEVISPKKKHSPPTNDLIPLDSISSPAKRLRTSSDHMKGWRRSFHADPAKDGIKKDLIIDHTNSKRHSITLTTVYNNNKDSLKIISNSGIWSKVGHLSDRASEILDDAIIKKIKYNTKEETHLNNNDRTIEPLEDHEPIVSLDSPNDILLSRNSSKELKEIIKEKINHKNELMIDTKELSGQRIENQFKIHWEGYLTKRSEWLRRWEKSYYVLDGLELIKYTNKDAYVSTMEETSPIEDDNNNTNTNHPLSFTDKIDVLSSIPSIIRNNSLGNNNNNNNNHLISVYKIASIKESNTRQYSFNITTTDNKILLLAATTPVEKMVWVRIILEGLSTINNNNINNNINLYLQLDIDEFYAMLVVLYNANSNDWRTIGDMAVTLPPPEELVFSRFFNFLSLSIIITSNYPPSVPFSGIYRGYSGLLSYIHEFSIHTKWSKFQIEGLTSEGPIAVASGKEVLENRKDSRKFTQNWIHKFTFIKDYKYNNKKVLYKIDINGDVVAASAVFKLPGAATTLKLPNEFQQVEGNAGKEGKIIIRVLQANGLKYGDMTSYHSNNNNNNNNNTNNRKNIKEPHVKLYLKYGEHNDHLNTMNNNNNNNNGNTLGSSMSVPKLTRRLSSSMSLRGSTTINNNDMTTTTTYNNNINIVTTGPPRNQDIMDNDINNNNNNKNNNNPVWETYHHLTYENLQGRCYLMVEIVDKTGKNTFTSIGQVHINIAKYIMENNNKKNLFDSNLNGNYNKNELLNKKSESKWYTISNQKGEYCGKILLDISCENIIKNKINKYISIDTKKKIHKPLHSQSLSPNFFEDQAIPAQWSNNNNKPLKLKRANTFSENEFISSTNTNLINNKINSKNRIKRGWSNIHSLNLMSFSPSKNTSNPDNNNNNNNNNNLNEKISNYDEIRQTNINNTLNNTIFHAFSVCGAPFVVPKRYNLIKVCGKGAYGIVIAATNTLTGGNVAIKKVIDCIWHPHQLKQVLREIKLMKHLAHENILSLMDLIPPPSYLNFRDIYMTVDLMEMDLHRIIYSKEILSDDHIRYFLYQLLCGLLYMHKSGVLHRDLKPSNLLINSDCTLKICDMGLARCKNLNINKGMTEYVVTRWYRAPELLLGSTYDEGIDLWSAACIFAEMLGRKPLFPGRSYVHQLQLIINVLGISNENDMNFELNPQAQRLKGRQLLLRTPSNEGMNKNLLFSNANPEALDLLWKMLVFDTKKRITVLDALKHPYLNHLYNEDKDNRNVDIFNFNFDNLKTDEDLKEEIFKEICHFHPEEKIKRQKQLATLPVNDILPTGWVKRESRSVPGKYYYTDPKRGISTWVKPTE